MPATNTDKPEDDVFSQGVALANKERGSVFSQGVALANREKELSESPVGKLKASGHELTANIADINLQTGQAPASAMVGQANLLSHATRYLTALMPSIGQFAGGEDELMLPPDQLGAASRQAQGLILSEPQTKEEFKRDLGKRMGVGTLEPQTVGGRIAQESADTYAELRMWGVPGPVAGGFGLLAGIAQGERELGLPEWMAQATNLSGLFGSKLKGAADAAWNAGVKRLLAPWNYEAREALKAKHAVEKTTLQTNIAAREAGLFPEMEKDVTAYEKSAIEEAGLIREKEKHLVAEKEAREAGVQRVSGEFETAAARERNRLEEETARARAEEATMVGRAKTAEELAADKAATAKKTKERVEKLANMQVNMAGQQKAERLRHAAYLEKDWKADETLQKLHDRFTGGALFTISEEKLSADQVGARVKEELNAIHAEEREAASSAYKPWTEEVKGKKGKMNPVVAAAKRVKKELLKVFPSKAGESGIINQLNSIIEGGEKNPERLLTLMHEDKKALFSGIDFEITDPTLRKKVNQKLLDVTNAYEGSMMSGMSSNEKKLYRTAQDGWRAYTNKWHNEHVLNARNLPEGGRMNYANPEVFAAVAPCTKETLPFVERKAVEQMTKTVGETTMQETQGIRSKMSEKAQKAAEDIINVKTKGYSPKTIHAKQHALVLEWNDYMVNGTHPTQMLSMMKDPREYKVLKDTMLQSENGQGIMDHLHQLSREDIFTRMSQEGNLSADKIVKFRTDPENRFLYKTVMNPDHKAILDSIVEDQAGMRKHVDNTVKALLEAEEEVKTAKAITTETKGLARESAAERIQRAKDRATGEIETAKKPKTQAEAEQEQFAKHYKRRMKELNEQRTKAREGSKEQRARAEEKKSQIREEGRRELSEMEKRHLEEIKAIEADTLSKHSPFIALMTSAGLRTASKTLSFIPGATAILNTASVVTANVSLAWLAKPYIAAPFRAFIENVGKNSPKAISAFIALERVLEDEYNRTQKQEAA